MTDARAPTIPVSQQPSISLPLRRVLLGGSVLYLLAAMLPWYRIEGRGFVIEFSGLHELGVLVGILAVYVAVWEILRLTGLPPIDGDRGDRFSAVGGLAFGATGAVFVLQRLTEGSLAYGWLIGSVLVTAVLAAAIGLFSVADGPEALATFAGLRDRGDDEEPPRTPSTSARPRPRTPTAVELAAPGADRPSGDRSPGATWTGSPYARGSHAAGGAPGGAAGTGGPWSGTAAGRGATAPSAASSGRGTAPSSAVGPAGPGPAGIPTGKRRRSGRTTRPAPEVRRDPAPRPGAGRSGTPGPGQGSGPRPTGRDAGAPPASGWPKTPAERQRDAPPLWAGSRERHDRPER